MDKRDSRTSVTRNVFRIRELRKRLEDQEEFKEQHNIDSKKNKALSFFILIGQIIKSLFVDSKIKTQRHPEGIKINWAALTSLATVLMLFVALIALVISYQANETSRKALEETNKYNNANLKQNSLAKSPSLDITIDTSKPITAYKDKGKVFLFMPINIINIGHSKAYNVSMYMSASIAMAVNPYLITYLSAEIKSTSVGDLISLNEIDTYKKAGLLGTCQAKLYTQLNGEIDSFGHKDSHTDYISSIRSTLRYKDENGKLYANDKSYYINTDLINVQEGYKNKVNINIKSIRDVTFRHDELDGNDSNDTNYIY